MDVLKRSFGALLGFLLLVTVVVVILVVTSSWTTRTRAAGIFFSTFHSNVWGYHVVVCYGLIDQVLTLYLC